MLRRRVRQRQTQAAPPTDEAGEIRCRSLVVVDEAGHERIVLATGRHEASVLVTVPSARGRTAGVIVYAVDGEELDGEPALGVGLISDGNLVREWRLPSNDRRAEVD